MSRPGEGPGFDMVSLTSEQKHPSRTPTLLIAVAVLAIGLAAIVLIARQQKTGQAGPSSDPAAVPGMIRAGSTDFEYFRNRVRVENVKASLGITFSQARVAFVSGVIVNDSDRRLEALEMRIRLFDLYDKLSKERIATPLRPGMGLYKPMEPLERRSFSVGVESVEQLWNPKRLELEITGIKYE